MCEKTQAELLKEELFYSAQHASYTCEDDEIAVATCRLLAGDGYSIYKSLIGLVVGECLHNIRN